MSNTNRTPAGRQKALAVVQMVIVLAFLAAEIYQLVRYGLALTHAILLVLWIVCLFFVIKNLLRTFAAERAAIPEEEKRTTPDRGE